MKSARLVLVFCFVAILVVTFVPEASFASLESSLNGLRNSLVRVILPILAAIGMAIAAVSFFMGSPKAKDHFYLALFGAFIAFGGQALLDWVQAIVR